jgi:hypothetical protein
LSEVLPGGARSQLTGVLGAGIDLPPLASSVHELSLAYDRPGTVLGMARAGMNEPEAPAGLNRKGFGIVGHGITVAGWWVLQPELPEQFVGQPIGRPVDLPPGDTLGIRTWPLGRGLEVAHIPGGSVELTTERTSSGHGAHGS